MSDEPRIPRYLQGLPFHLAPPAQEPEDERSALIAAARMGDLDATLIAASMLFAGDGGPPDEPLAIALLSGPAESGSPEAMFMLGGILWNSQGREREGLAWVQRALDAGMCAAAYVLGMAAARGQGMARDLPLARQFLSVACRAGVPEAHAQLELLIAQERHA